MFPVKLHYDGKNVFEGCTADLRQWTVVNHWIDANGADRYRSTFSIGSLIELGVIRQ